MILLDLKRYGCIICYTSYTIHTTGGIKMNTKGKYAWTARVGEKGQIVIPSEARKIFDINPGDTLLILGDEQQGLAIVKKSLFQKFAAALLNAKEEKVEEECLL
jgi:AbrB family looped-hinge helix DNA binding protein